MKERKEQSLSELVIEGTLLDCGELHISRSTPNKARGRARYLIYLPINRNYLWESLWKNKVKVRVFLIPANRESS